MTFDDNSRTETAFQLQGTINGTTWQNVGTPTVWDLTAPNPLVQPYITADGPATEL